jgi:archaemetzincin
MAARDELLPPPRRGEWRSVVREREQSFDDYVRGCANRKTPARSVLRLQPLGPVEPALLDLLRDYGAAFFGLDARVDPARPLPDAADVPKRGQHNSSMILDALAERVRGDALVTLAVTDLFSRGKKYVFGEGDLERGVGVCSLSRLRSPDRTLFLRRALRLTTHEAGHILSIAHCVTRRCLMQGANTLEESDRHPLEPCSEDLRKIAWNTGVDPAQRKRKLRVVLADGLKMDSGGGN